MEYVLSSGSAENCGSLSTGRIRCTWTDSRGCVRNRGRRGVCAGGSAENCGSLSTGNFRCTWTDSRGCVRSRVVGGGEKQMNKPSSGGEACCFRYYFLV